MAALKTTGSTSSIAEFRKSRLRGSSIRSGFRIWNPYVIMGRRLIQGPGQYLFLIESGAGLGPVPGETVLLVLDEDELFRKQKIGRF
jgi:hypothetical protein